MIELFLLSMSWINHLPPACWSTFWKSNFKQQLGCRFDIMDNKSYFFLCFDICNYICLDTSDHFRFYLLKYSLFFSSTLVLTSSIDIVFILSITMLPGVSDEWNPHTGPKQKGVKPTKIVYMALGLYYWFLQYFLLFLICAIIPMFLCIHVMCVFLYDFILHRKYWINDMQSINQCNCIIKYKILCKILAPCYSWWKEHYIQVPHANCFIVYKLIVEGVPLWVCGRNLPFQWLTWSGIKSISSIIHILHLSTK